MTKFFYKNKFNRIICLVMTVTFLSSFPAGALALCLDSAEEESHLVGQNLNLVDCHTSVEAKLRLSSEHYSASTEKKSNDCVDVSLTNANTLNFPTKLFLPTSAKIIITFQRPYSNIGLQEHNPPKSSSALSPPSISTTFYKSHRTAILLI
jgi:hypothetical protein